MTKWWIALTVVAACGGGGGDTFDAPRTIDGPPPAPDAPSIDADPGECSGDGTGQSNGGFVKPTVVSHAWQEASPGVWTDLGPADWSCVPRRLETTHPGGVFGGTIVDLQTGAGVPLASVEWFIDGDLASPDATVTADGQGDYAFDVGNAIDLAFRISAPDYFTTVHLAPPTPVTNLGFVSEALGQAFVALLGLVYEGGPLVLGRVQDCAGNTVSDVVVTASVQTDCVAHGEGAATFYFNTSQSLPVRNNTEPVSTENGLYMVMLDAATAGQVQIWGFAAGDDPATAPLRLLATRSVALDPETVTLIAIPAN
jgi:hypothetical protein